MTTPNDMTASPATAIGEPEATAHCRNCSAPLLGPHCYACGQPVRGLVRPLGNLFGDLMDSVFDLDLRILRSLGPLFRKPGFLTLEYFGGRRVPYVTPVRLFFFLCILAFFVARLTMSGDDVVVTGDMDNTVIGAAATESEVVKARDVELAKLAATRAAIPQGPGKVGAESGLQSAERAVRRTADQRLEQLRVAASRGEPTPPAIEDSISFNGDPPWHPKTNPVAIPGMPAFFNVWVNGKIERALDNVKRLQKDKSSYKDAFLGAIPTALFLLVPIFALMLKLIYLLKRRIYMEHLVVALHSHAFLSLALLLVLACVGLQQVVPVDGALDTLLEMVTGLLLAWVPVYLLLMQKRVYGQGWPMTLLKFSVLGICYMMLLGFAISGAALASLVWL